MNFKYALTLIVGLLILSTSFARVKPTNKELTKEDVKTFKELYKASIDQRKLSLNIYEEIKDKFDKKIPLDGGELEKLSIEIVTTIKIHRELKKLALKYYSTIKNKKADEMNRYKASAFSLAITFNIIDNYTLTYNIFEAEPKLRRFLNEPNPTYDKEKNMLKEYVLDISKSKHIRYKRKSLKIFKKYDDQKLYEQLEGDEDFAFLKAAIVESDYYKMRTSKNLGLKLKTWFKFSFASTKTRFRSVFDRFIKIVQGIVWGGSQFFGNTLGRFQSRKGKLYDSFFVENQLQELLQPLDVVLEKTPFRLTDRFIPGHYGHNAIYIGTKEQLTDLGLWDHPVVKKFHDIIEKEGKLIVEALRPGVQINTIKHFLDIDDLAVMRRKELTDDFIKSGIIMTLKQVGKRYDFNFNVETQDTLVCSELIYMVYTYDIFVTERTLGRWTINPDSVARKGINGTFDIILLYSDGVEVKGDLEKQMKFILDSSTKKKK